MAPIPAEVAQLGDQGEHVVAQALGLVDEQEHLEATFLGPAPNLVLDVAQHADAGEGGGDTEFESDQGTQIPRGSVGVGDVDQLDLLGMQLVSQSAKRGGFSTSGLAGQQAEGSVLDEEPEPGVQFVEIGSPKELVAFQVVMKGGVGESESVAIGHGSILLAAQTLDEPVEVADVGAWGLFDLGLFGLGDRWAPTRIGDRIEQAQPDLLALATTP